MVFSSNVFLFLFLPLFLAGYYLCPDRHRSWLITGASYAFYAWWRVDFLFLFVAMTAWNYWVGQAIYARGVRTAAARKWLIVGVGVDLAILGCFKYANFGVASFNTLVTGVGFEAFSWSAILLPIGISFYTFEAISYIADVYRGDCEPVRKPIDFACFLAMFPHLIAGPVFRYKDLHEQFHQRTHTLDKFAEGSTRFMQGFIKKVFIADSIAPLVAEGFALADPTTADAWLTTLAYTAQLYFDFSGYTDMAIGLGLMMGFRFVENFNQPYISQSITEFWRRWHMSLSAWLRDYLYIALGGNRGGVAKTYRNLFLTMLLGGLWHGANWTFVIWGAWHGAILSIERRLGVQGNPSGFNPARMLLTLMFVMLGWVMFRAETVAGAMTIYAALFRFDGLGLSELYGAGITSLQIWTLVLAWLVIFGRGLQQRLRRGDAGALAPAEGGAGTVARWREHTALLALVPLFALAVLKLSAQSYSPFLYFQF
ncbi:MAG TPA: MBOAT family protein [Verrucomicrobiae bacterium]|nr:MBOAT family protein [Verrucomicrobiae bacterium]